MTAEVDARSEVSQVLDKGGLAHEDFAKGGARVGDGISLPKGNEIDSDGACGSYVMINGSDEVADDSVHMDPNPEVELECSGNGNIETDAEPKIENRNEPKFCVFDEIGGVGHVVGRDLGESASNWLMNDIEARNNVSEGDQKQEEDTETESFEKVEEIPKSEDAVCDAADDNCNYPQANCKEDKHDVKIMSDSNGIVGEFGELTSSITHNDAFVPEQNGDAVYKDDHGNKLNASPNKHEEDVAYDENNLILGEKHLVVNGEDSVVGQSGDKEEELEQNFVSVPTIEVSVLLERDIVDHSLPHGSGVCHPAGEDQDGNPQTAEDVKSENAYDDCDIVSGETCATSIDTATKMAIVGEGPFEDLALVLEKSSAESSNKDTCLVDDKDVQAEGSISHGRGGHALVVEKSSAESSDKDTCLVDDKDAQAEGSISHGRGDRALVVEKSSAESSDKDTCHVDDKVAQAEGSISHGTGDHALVVEKSSAESSDKDPCLVDDNDAQAEGSISHGRGDCLAAEQDQDGDPQYDDCEIVSGEICAISTVSATKMDIVGERPLEDHALVLEKSSQDSETDKCLIDDKDALAEGSISHGRGDCLAAGQDQDGDPQYDDCEIVSGETCAISTDSATKMDIVGERPLEDHPLVMEKSSQDSETDKCLIDDKDSQAEGSISGDKGDELPTSPDEDIASNTSMPNDLVLSSQNILEGNRQLENTVMASSIVMVGSVEINCDEVFPSLPFNNAAIKSFQFSPAVENLRLDLKVKSSPESIDNPDSCCLQGTKIKAKSENGSVDEDTQSICFSNDQGNLNHVSDVNEVESEGSTYQEVKVVDEINWGSSLGTLECSTHDTAGPLNVVSEVGSGPVYRSPSYEEDTQSSCLSNDQGSINHASEVNEVESNGSTSQEVKVIDEINWDSSFGTQCSTLDTAEPLNVVAEVGSGSFHFVRIPRFEDESIREKIKHAQSLVDEKTQTRDSFRDQIQTTKAACKELGSNLSAAKSEARAARESLKLKRKEIETAQSMINKAKDAISIDDIGIRINKMEHKIAHETLPLKEEKQLIRDIKQLTQLRDQLSLGGKQGELQLALDQKGEVEERLTLLRKEMDLMKANVLKADELTTSMLKKYDGEREKLNGLQAQFEEANKIRQEAYVHLQSLKKPLDEKRKYFRKYKNDMEEADNLALRKDGEKLQAHANQVETFMERWNNDDEFRKDYVRCNTRSTLRRLGTSDGRSLAPDEERPVLNNVIKERAATNSLVSPGLTVEQNKPAGQVETVKDKHKPAKGAKKKNQETETKNPVAAVPTLPDAQASVSGGVELVDTKDSSGLDFADTIEEDKRSKEEDELEKIAEKWRKEEEAIRLKEQLKLEEKAKAEIALERKKRKAEKAQARAAIRAQKEAEEKQKEKEKKARRKKKKAAGGEAKNEADIEEEPAASMETPTVTQNTEKSKTPSTKSQKRPPFTKAKPLIPPPLRKRGKRKMETWMWILLTVAIVLAAFFLGNLSFLRKLAMGKFSF